ncbi:MAG TPA: TMEM175 family protein [Candidatus Bathyarchaeia archaeon]|nr:TMEM175 family protein [Candidatus Bathyarchaeia archaeon]
MDHTATLFKTADSFLSQMCSGVLREPHGPKPRLESLTDLIFGLALSIGALALLKNNPDSVSGLWIGVGIFGFSFLILISIWLRYTETMSVLPIETSVTRTLNILLLFLVALEPYLFNLIGSSLSEDASVAYAIDIGSIYAILASFNNILTSQGRVLVQPDLVRKYRVIRNLQIGVAIIFWISIIPGSYTSLQIGPIGVPLRFILWMTTFLLSRGTWVLRRMGRI